MKMYTPSGDAVLVEKSQVPALEKAGWTKDKKPEVKSEPESDGATTSTEEEEVSSEEIDAQPKKFLRKKKA